MFCEVNEEFVCADLSNTALGRGWWIFTATNKRWHEIDGTPRTPRHFFVRMSFSATFGKPLGWPWGVKTTLPGGQFDSVCAWEGSGRDVLIKDTALEAPFQAYGPHLKNKGGGDVDKK